MTTPNGLAFFIKSAIKNKLNNGATNSPFVLAVTSVILPGIRGIAMLKRITTIPIIALLILMFLRLLTSPFFLLKTGKISVIKTELDELTPEDRLDMDAENNAAITRPDIPAGN